MNDTEAVRFIREEMRMQVISRGNALAVFDRARRERFEDLVYSSRLVVLPRLSPDDYIRLVASADASLDTPYFGGSNTAYDAVAMGAPVVTLPGEMPRSRYTAALYESMGITDCIAASPDEYMA